MASVGFDWTIFLALALICAASLIVFFVNVRRETTHRAQHRLIDWGHRNGFRRTDLDIGAPAPCDRLTPALDLKISFASRTTRLVHLRGSPQGYGDAPEHWNLAIRGVGRSSPPVGLRSAEDRRSIVDLFHLAPAPHQPAAARFTIVGEDVVASRALADGSSRSLLPGDLSLLRIDEFLVIDFSDRPFDEIEFGRMLALLDQLASIA